jgi:hypothetical protein
MAKVMTPVLESEMLLDFPDAIRKVIDGKRIARIAWKNADYAVLRDGFLEIFHQKEGDKLANFHKWLINDGDLTSIDWIVLPDLQ